MDQITPSRKDLALIPPPEKRSGIFISTRTMTCGMMVVCSFAGGFFAGQSSSNNHQVYDAVARVPVTTAPLGAVSPEEAIPAVVIPVSDTVPQPTPSDLEKIATRKANLAPEGLASEGSSPETDIERLLSAPAVAPQVVPSQEDIPSPDLGVPDLVFGEPIDVSGISDPAVREAVELGIERARARVAEIAAAPSEDVPAMPAGAVAENWSFSENEGESFEGAGDQAYSGPATVVSPDSISVNDVIVRISDVLVPDMTSVCVDGSGQPYDCLAWVMNGMSESLNGKPVTCVAEGGPLGACETDLGGGRFADIGSWLVSSGMALSGPEEGVGKYAAEETSAKAEGRGVWSGTFSFSGRSFPK